MNPRRRNRRWAVQSPCAEQVSHVIQSAKDLLTSLTETYIEIDSDDQLSVTTPNLAAFATPRPAQKKELVEASESDGNSNSQFESDGNSNSQIESEDDDSQIASDLESESDNFETPKALRTKKVAPTISSDDEMIDGDAEVDYATESNQRGETETDTDTSHREKKSSKKEPDTSRREKKLSKKEPAPVINLAKVQKPATKKDKQAFRKEVQAKRVLVVKEDKVR